MWYVIQTTSGTEHEVCLWVNCNVDKGYYSRCFVPLFEDVRKKNGVGHISVKRMFPSYFFIESDMPDKVNEELKRMPGFTRLLSSEEKNGRVYAPLREDEEIFFDTILSDGIMRVSYIHSDKRGKLDRVFGPLQYYKDNIIRVDASHRYAIISIPFLGGNKTVKMGLWLDDDPAIPWIEEEKRNQENKPCQLKTPDDVWNWKEWKQINDDRQHTFKDENIYGFKIGGYVINTLGLYGDTPLEIYEVHPKKNSITVNAPLFGTIVRVDMGMDEVELVGV